MQNHASQSLQGGLGNVNNSNNSSQGGIVALNSGKIINGGKSGSQHDLYMLQKQENKTSAQLMTSSNASQNKSKLANSKSVSLSKTEIKFRMSKQLDTQIQFTNTSEQGSPLPKPSQTHEKIYVKASSRESNFNNLTNREMRPHSQQNRIISTIAGYGESNALHVLPQINKDKKDTKSTQVDVNNEMISKLLQQTKSPGSNTPNKGKPSQSNMVIQKTLQMLSKEEHSVTKQQQPLNSFSMAEEHLNKYVNTSKPQTNKNQTISNLSIKIKQNNVDSPDSMHNQGSSQKQQYQSQGTPNYQTFRSQSQSNLTKNLTSQFTTTQFQYPPFPPSSPYQGKTIIQNTSQSMAFFQNNASKNLFTSETNDSPRKIGFGNSKESKITAVGGGNENNTQMTTSSFGRQFFPSKVDEIKYDSQTQLQNEYYIHDQTDPMGTRPASEANLHDISSKMKVQQSNLRNLNTQQSQRKGSYGQSENSQSPMITPTELGKQLLQSAQVRVTSQFDSSKAKKSYGELQDIVQNEKNKPFGLLNKQKFFIQDVKDNSETQSSAVLGTNQSFQKGLGSPSSNGLNNIPQNNCSSRQSNRIFSPTKQQQFHHPSTPQTASAQQHNPRSSSNNWIENIKRMQNPFFVSGTEEIEETLKKELPNIQSDVPSNRNDVLILQKWYEFGLKSISSSDEKKKFQYHYIAFQELIRQITLDCSERGFLLKEVVFKIGEYYQKQIQSIKEDIFSEKAKSQEEVTQTRKFYENLFQKKEKESEEIKKQNDELKNKQLSENKEIFSLQGREKELNSQLNNLKSISQFLKEQLKKLSEDNLKLRMKLKKRKYNLDQKLVKQLQNDPKLAEELSKMGSQQMVKKGDGMSLLFQNNDSSKKSSNNKSKQQPPQKQKRNSYLSVNDLPSFNNIPKVQQISKFEGSNFSSDSDDSFTEKKLKKGEKEEFSLLQPYIRKHTIDQQQLVLTHLNQSTVSKQNSQSRRNSHTSNKSFTQNNIKDLKRSSVNSVSSNILPGAQNTIDINKKILQIAIQEQIEENEISSFSSEDSKLIIDEAQNDMVDINHLNAVGFIDPESAIKKECAETQVNVSLLEFAFSTSETQTTLSIVDSKYDDFMVNSDDIDQLIDFRIQGIKQIQTYLETDKTFNIIEFQQEMNMSTAYKPLKQTASSYKGKFNKYEKLYEESLQEVALVTQQLEKLNLEKNQFFIREKELLEEIALIKMQLKKEREEELRRLAELERQKKEEEEEERKRKKKAAELPDKWKNYSYLVSKQRNKDGSPMNYKSDAPKLGQRAIIDFDKQYQTDLGQIIIDKLSNKKYNKFKNFMPVSTILKQINLIYQDRIKQVQENQRFKEISCSNFAYIFLTKIFGLKKIVDQKFIIFILSLKRYLQIFRINMFARFLGILEQKNLNFTLDEYNKYIESLDYIQNQCTIGKDLEISESETKYYVPYLKVAAFVGNFADARFTTEETTEFKKEVDSLKENDPRYPNVQVMDFDIFVHKMLNKYRMLVNRAKTYVINAFNASDLDGNGVCNLEEFLILNRNIEAENYNEEILTQIFNDNADNYVEGEPNLTFDKFAVVCVDFNLFSDEAQDKFLNLRHKRELDLKFEELKKIWPSKKIDYEKKINTFKFTEQETKEKWMEITSVLNERLTSNETQELKPLLIAEKILERELEFLEIFEQEGFEDEEALNKFVDEDFKDKVNRLPENAQNQVIEKLKSSLVRKSTFSFSQNSISEDTLSIKNFLQTIVSIQEKDMKKAKALVKMKLQEKLDQFSSDSLIMQIELMMAPKENQSPKDSLSKQDSQQSSIKINRMTSDTSISEALSKSQIELLIYAKQEIETSTKKNLI